MRITNKIIQNNTISNINNVKTISDQLNTQLVTGKKIVRPSDNPVIAVRALRLRSDVSQLVQYHEFNVKDAQGWLEVTQGAIGSTAGTIGKMRQEFTIGSKETLTVKDRNILLQNLKNLKDEVYATANADSMGRSVFAGYRTEESIIYKEDTRETYQITEQLYPDGIDTIKHINSRAINNIDEVNYATPPNDAINETNINETTVHRIRLSYNQVDDVVPTITTYNPNSVPPGYETLAVATVASEHDPNSPYENVGPDDVILVRETGELLIGSNIYNGIKGLKDDYSTDGAIENQFRITYNKSKWDKGDLKPIHYFSCSKDPGTPEAIHYNASYLDNIIDKQPIEYDVGMNQTIRINTTADEVFKHAVARDVEDGIRAINEVSNLEATVARLKSIKNNPANVANASMIERQIDASNKALTLAREKMQNLFEHGITKMANHNDTVIYAETNSGSTSAKLELIEKRLAEQKQTFKNLKSENEDANAEEVAIQLKTAQLTYDAALMSAGKISQNSLLKYI